MITESTGLPVAAVGKLVTYLGGGLYKLVYYPFEGGAVTHLTFPSHFFSLKFTPSFPPENSELCTGIPARWARGESHSG